MTSNASALYHLSWGDHELRLAASTSWASRRSRSHQTRHQAIHPSRGDDALQWHQVEYESFGRMISFHFRTRKGGGRTVVGHITPQRLLSFFCRIALRGTSVPRSLSSSLEKRAERAGRDFAIVDLSLKFAMRYHLRFATTPYYLL